MKSRNKYLLLIAVIVFFLLVVGEFIRFYLNLYNSAPIYNEEVGSPFFMNEVEVFWDRMGIPHIYAHKEEEALFALGYIHAMERLFQMELFRRMAQGKLSEIFGISSLESDKFYKSLNFADIVKKEEFILEPELYRKLQMYINGINLYIKKHEHILAPEFQLLNIKPELWTVKDTLLVQKIMSWNFSNNYERKKIIWKHRNKIKASSNVIINYDTEDFPVIVKESNEESSVNKFIKFMREGLASNAWVVDSSKSKSKDVIMANDTYTAAFAPPVWYISHICVKDDNRIGASIPGNPFYLIGRNEDIGWAINELPADIQDIVLLSNGLKSQSNLMKKVYKINVRDKGIVLVNSYLGEFMRGIEAIIDKTFGGKDYIILWSGFVPSENMKALYMLNKAKNWSEFRSALSMMSVPALNFIYGDREGNIGHYPAGLIPKRRLPISMSPYYELQKWIGWLSEEEKAIAFNPSHHYILKANNKVSDDTEYGIDWFGSFRSLRINELLNSKSKYSVDDFNRFQLDVKSKIAEILLPYIKSIPDKYMTKEAKDIYNIISNWDMNVNNSKGAIAFEVFFVNFTKDIFEDELGKDLYKEYANYLMKGGYAGVLSIIKEKNNYLFDDVRTTNREDRDVIIGKALNDTFIFLRTHFGEDINNWKWRLLHKVEFYNLLNQNWLAKRLFGMKEIGLDGGLDTVNMGKFSLDDKYRVSIVSSLRFIFRLSDINETYMIMNTGQSGNPFSKFYDNQLKWWLKGDLYKLVTEKEVLMKEGYDKMIFYSIKR